MEQDLYYSLRFNLNENNENIGTLFSSINFFAELYHRLDSLLIAPLPLNLEFSRSLKDFGENSFLFVFKDHITYPGQFPLGHQPDIKDVETWMITSRKLFSGIFNKKMFNSVEELKIRLDELGEALNFKNLLSYRPVRLEDLENIIIDFQNAGNFLDLENGVIIFE